MKNKLMYIIFVVILILFVSIITISYLLINYKEQGTFEYDKVYNEILLTNTIIDYDTTTSVKLNNEENNIHIDIPDLNEYKTLKTFSIDMENIGNTSVYISDIYYSNNVSNINTEYIKIDSSLKKGDIIKGNEIKRIYIDIKYNGNYKDIIPFYNFNINYSFEDVPL